MTRKLLALIAALLASGAAIAFLPTTTTAQTDTAQANRMKAAVQEAVKNSRQFNVQTFVHMSFHGSMDQVGEFITRLRREFETQKVAGVGPQDRPYLVLHGNPDQTPTLNMDLGYAIATRDRPSIKLPLKVSNIALNRAAQVSHSGNVRGLSQIHKAFESEARGRARKTTVLHLKNYVSAENVQIELILPLDNLPME